MYELWISKLCELEVDERIREGRLIVFVSLGIKSPNMLGSVVYVEPICILVWGHAYIGDRNTDK